MMEKTSSRVAMALMCGLAICCAVMYVTADGAESVHQAQDYVNGIGGPTGVETFDVEKAGDVFTNTPDGRMRLTDYLSNVEAEIAQEQAERKKDVEAVRQQMARNFAFNKAARAKLNTMLLAKMAVNAKKAKDDLATSMRHVQAQFAHAAKLQNERNNANIARNKALKKKIAQNKALAAKQLSEAVTTQQRAMSTLKQKTNSRITQTNKHVSQNAADIKENAKKAADDLAHMVNQYDQKAANAREEAAKGRDKLATQLADQDKATRAWSGNKLKEVAQATAAQFRKVRAKMAEDRIHADLALKAASTRMTASLNAFKAVNDDNFNSNMADIATAKKEAEARVAAAETSFKVGLLALQSTVTEQVQRTNARLDQLNDQVTANKVAQAKINANVAAERKRMIKLGDDRYQEHVKKDAELKSLIDSNKVATDGRLDAMSKRYTMDLNSVRAEMKKNRAHASHMLTKKSSELYDAIAKSEKKQMGVNGELQAQTRQAALDIANELHAVKSDFAEKLGALHTTVVQNDKKFEGKLLKLTGIVREDAVKNEEGRGQLKTIIDANKKGLDTAVRDAIQKGETRMKKAETSLMALNKKTKAALNMKITTQISKLTAQANSQIEGLRLQSKEARAEMRKELLMAVRLMADNAKANLDEQVAIQQTNFAGQETKMKAAAKANAEDRAKIAAEIVIQEQNAQDELAAAVGTMAGSLLALKLETGKKIKATNKKVTAYADAVDAEAEEVKTIMANQMQDLMGKIDAQKDAAAKDIKAADADSVAAFEGVMDKVTTSLKAAAAASDARFVTATKDMASQRADLDEKLANAVTKMNDSIAKEVALQDFRFSKTVDDISAARKEAQKEVKDARAEFSTGLLTVTSTIKDMEKKLISQTEQLADQVIDHRAVQARVNRKTYAEIKRIEVLQNDRQTENSKARGKIKEIMNKNKQIAAEEVQALDKLFKGKITDVRKESADDSLSARKDLTQAAEELEGKMAKAQTDQIYANQDSATKISTFSQESLAGIATARAAFDGRLIQLSNTIVANHKHVERGFEQLTGVVRNFKEQGATERRLIKEQNEAMAADMSAKIVESIRVGEAKAKAVADRARRQLKGAQKSMMIQITMKVEQMADETFASIQKNHAKIADNYLSFKAYAMSASKAVTEYVGHGKGKNLSSLGDLLMTVGALGALPTQAEEGVMPANDAADTGFAPAIFNGAKIPIDSSVSKINGLVNEYTRATRDCRSRWPMGLGKYLLAKLEDSMLVKGVLMVDKVDEKPGNYVFVDGHTVGLSNRLNDFENLAVKMGDYEKSLAKLTARLSGKVPANPAPIYVPAPEYMGTR